MAVTGNHEPTFRVTLDGLVKKYFNRFEEDTEKGKLEVKGILKRRCGPSERIKIQPKRIRFDGNVQEISNIEDDDDEVIIIADNLVKDLADQSTDPKDADEIRKLLKQLSEKDHALDRCKHDVAKYKKVFSQLVNYMLKTGKKLGYDIPLSN